MKWGDVANVVLKSTGLENHFLELRVRIKIGIRIRASVRVSTSTATFYGYNIVCHAYCER